MVAGTVPCMTQRLASAAVLHGQASARVPETRDPGGRQVRDRVRDRPGVHSRALFWQPTKAEASGLLTPAPLS